MAPPLDTPKHLPQNGFDRQNLVAVRKRFIEINDRRLQRMRAAMSNRQHIFLDTLLMLFHSNHPMLPGFVSRNTPARVSSFKPKKIDITNTKRIARSFTLSYEPEKDEEIYGIYIMGSVGTIAQSESSDLDIWVCSKPGLSQASLKELNEKSEKISEWALSFGLEVHFFIMGLDDFKKGKLSELNEESSGSAQKLLLLDEFYRTAIFIGGRIPLWWFIPDNQAFEYNEYANTLLEKRFLNPKIVLDFGGVTEIPISEFLGAGVWQLYKAIESPYKSALKLLLLETYVNDYPKIEPLSLTFKALVYNGELDIDAMDSYVMIYRRIENYLLAINQPQRLELARRCFYFKVNKPLSKPPRGREKSWQRLLLEKLTQEWGWGAQQIAIMDKRHEWKTPRVIDERTQLVNELNHSYQFLVSVANRAKASRAISQDELTILGRKLHAAFERRPGKIEWINPNISKDLTESVAIFKRFYDESSKSNIWTVYSEDTENKLPELTGIKSSASIIELTLWCFINCIITPSTQIEVQDDSPINKNELKRILGAYQSWLSTSGSAKRHKQFKKSAYPTELLLLINVGHIEHDELSQKGLQRLSDQTDALRYGGFEENLITSVDMVTRNSWNEITCRRYEKKSSLLDCVVEYLQLCIPGTHQRPPKITIKCISDFHSATILRRVKYWLNEVIQCFYGKDASRTHRFIFQMESKYYCLGFDGFKPKISETLQSKTVA